MKWVFVFLFMLAAACNKKDPPIDGSYTMVAAKYGDSVLSSDEIMKYRTIKVLKNGYWIAASFFGNQEISFESGSGGTYTVSDGNCIEIVNFSSADNSIVGNTYTFKPNKDKYIREGMMDSDQYGKCIIREVFDKRTLNKGLQDESLEGVWQAVSGEWYGNKSSVVEEDRTAIKIYCYPSFIWAQYKPEAKEFIGAGGGTYQYNTKKLVEHLEYFSFFDITPGNFEIVVTQLPSGEIHQVANGGAGKEVWRKIQ